MSARQVYEFVAAFGFDLRSVGIQKDLLLASLIGNLLNLPTGTKTRLQQICLVLLGTLFATILTPLVIGLLNHFGANIPGGSGHGIAALLGILGTSFIRRFVLDKLEAKKLKLTIDKETTDVSDN